MKSIRVRYLALALAVLFLTGGAAEAVVALRVDKLYVESSDNNTQIKQQPGSTTATVYTTNENGRADVIVYCDTAGYDYYATGTYELEVDAGDTEGVTKKNVFDGNPLNSTGYIRGINAAYKPGVHTAKCTIDPANKLVLPPGDKIITKSKTLTIRVVKQLPKMVPLPDKLKQRKMY